MASHALRPLSIGEILDGAFTLLRRHFTSFLVLGLLALGPQAVIGLVASQLLANLLGIVVYFVYLGALVWSASEAVQGRTPQLGPALLKGLRKAFPLFTVAMFKTFAILFGLVLLVVPGICLQLMWFAWAPVIVIEDQWDFFGRSRALARDAWLKIGLTQLVYVIIAAMPSLVLTGSWMLTAPSLEAVGNSTEAPVWVFLSGLLVRLLTEPFSVVAWVLLYYDMRVRKDGLDVAVAMGDGDDEVWDARAQPAAPPGAGDPGPPGAARDAPPRG